MIGSGKGGRFFGDRHHQCAMESLGYLSWMVLSDSGLHNQGVVEGWKTLLVGDVGNQSESEGNGFCGCWLDLTVTSSHDFVFSDDITGTYFNRTGPLTHHQF